jgi:hypothetical protein
MKPGFISDEQNMKDIERYIHKADLNDYLRYETSRTQGLSVGRTLVVYQPDGLTHKGTHKPPQILSTLRITDFTATGRGGASVTIEDGKSGQTQVIGPVPTRLFRYDVFVHTPVSLQMRWLGTLLEDGSINSRFLTFPLVIRTRTPSGFYSRGVTCCETPGSLRRLYPDMNTDNSY